MPHYLLKIAYDGKGFHGVVPQKGVKTIIGTILEKLNLDPRETKYNVVSRTDKGVSAEENYLVISTLKSVDWETFDDPNIKILKVFELKEPIILRKIAQGKVYWYHLPKSLFDEKFIYKPKYIIIDDYKVQINYVDGDFSIELYERGAKKFIGTHRFFNFAKGSVENDVCTIREFRIWEENEFWINEIVGNRFLYEMIRRIVSFLVAVGKGRYPLDKIDLVLSGAKLEPKPPAAPPEFLVLKKVFLDWSKIYKILKDIII